MPYIHKPIYEQHVSIIYFGICPLSTKYYDSLFASEETNISTEKYICYLIYSA